VLVSFSLSFTGFSNVYSLPWAHPGSIKKSQFEDKLCQQNISKVCWEMFECIKGIAALTTQCSPRLMYAQKAGCMALPTGPMRGRPAGTLFRGLTATEGPET